MKLRARQLEMEEIPEEYRPSMGQIFITPGMEYEAHALAVFSNGKVSFHVVDNAGMPSWDPAFLFDVIDSTVPRDWVCQTLHEGPQLLLGPSFVAESWAAYSAMAELEPEPVRLFWNRLASLKAEREAALADEWRALGFYFTFDVECPTWLVVGSRQGIQTFCDVLLNWAATARRQQLPGFRSVGPRQDLKLVLAKQPRVRRNGLHGRPEDFERLAALIKESLASGQEVMMFGSLFMEGGVAEEAELEVCVAPGSFDPGKDGPKTPVSRKALQARAYITYLSPRA